MILTILGTVSLSSRYSLLRTDLTMSLFLSKKIRGSCRSSKLTAEVESIVRWCLGCEAGLGERLNRRIVRVEE